MHHCVKNNINVSHQVFLTTQFTCDKFCCRLMVTAPPTLKPNRRFSFMSHFNANVRFIGEAAYARIGQIALMSSFDSVTQL